VGRELECKQLRTSLLTVSLTSLRVWVINGARDFGQFACVLGELNEGSSCFGCGFLYDGSEGGGVLEGLTHIGLQISSASKDLSLKEQAAMFPSMYSVADWLKRRTDKPKLLARAAAAALVSFCAHTATTGTAPLLSRRRLAADAAGAVRTHHITRPGADAAAGHGRRYRFHRLL
jgi:hypothetical protein